MTQNETTARAPVREAAARRMARPESSSYLEVYENAEGDAVVDVYLSPEDVRAATRWGKVTIKVEDEEACLGVSEVHIRPTVAPADVRTAEHPRGHHRG